MSDSTFVKLNPEKLIELVEARPVLYNYNLKEYHNKVLIDQMWNEIAEGMGGTVAECRNKWHSIRNAFARHMREERNPELYTNCNGVKKKKWYLADMLGFLQNYMGHSCVGRKKYLNISTDCPEKSSQNSTELSCDYHLVQEIIITKEEKNTPIFDDKDNIEDDPSVFPEPLLQQSQRIPEKKRKIVSTPDSVEEIAQVASEYLKAKNQTEESESIHLNFFKSIIPDMVKLDGRRQRKFKEDVLSQLNYYLDEQENEFIVKNPQLFRTSSPCSFSKTFSCSSSSESLTVQAQSHPIWCFPVTSQSF